jgi:ribosome-associated toxin RatA of RatAB toxin-antitoxin module
MEIGADPVRVMSVITDLERYPEWVDALTSVDVLTTHDDKPETVRMALQTRFFSDDYTVSYRWQPDRVSWRLIEGTTLTAMDGSYTVHPTHGVGSTVTYELSVDLSLRLPGPVKRTAAKTITETALHGLRRQVLKVGDAR